MKILFAADVRGSTPMFLRFLDAVSAYEADVGVMLGDLTGSTLVPIVASGASRWRTSMGDQVVVSESEAELAALQAALELRGHYWVEVDEEEARNTRSYPAVAIMLLKGAASNRVGDWLRIVDERMGQSDVPIFLSPGANDSQMIDDVLLSGDAAHSCDGQAIETGGYWMITASATTVDDKQAIRRESRKDLLDHLERMMARVAVPGLAIVNCCPQTKSAETLVKRHQPLLRIMRSRAGNGGGASFSGRTLVLDPGAAHADYGGAGPQGVLVELEAGRVKDYGFVRA